LERGAVAETRSKTGRATIIMLNDRHIVKLAGDALAEDKRRGSHFDSVTTFAEFFHDESDKDVQKAWRLYRQCLRSEKRKKATDSLIGLFLAFAMLGGTLWVAMMFLLTYLKLIDPKDFDQNAPTALIAAAGITAATLWIIIPLWQRYAATKWLNEHRIIEYASVIVGNAAAVYAAYYVLGRLNGRTEQLIIARPSDLRPNTAPRSHHPCCPHCAMTRSRSGSLMSGPWSARSGGESQSGGTVGLPRGEARVTRRAVRSRPWRLHLAHSISTLSCGWSPSV
jgi:hypothetical protein